MKKVCWTRKALTKTEIKTKLYTSIGMWRVLQVKMFIHVSIKKFQWCLKLIPYFWSWLWYLFLLCSLPAYLPSYGSVYLYMYLLYYYLLSFYLLYCQHIMYCGLLFVELYCMLWFYIIKSSCWIWSVLLLSAISTLKQIKKLSLKFWT